MDCCSLLSTREDRITLLGLTHNITANYLIAILRRYLYTLYRYSELDRDDCAAHRALLPHDVSE